MPSVMVVPSSVSTRPFGSGHLPFSRSHTSATYTVGAERRAAPGDCEAGEKDEVLDEFEHAQSASKTVAAYSCFTQYIFLRANPAPAGYGNLH